MAAPDGGWGWLVVAGAVAANVAVVGHNKSFGIYVGSLMAEFDASPSQVAWLQSLHISTVNFLAPIASLLSQAVGARKVALVGGLLACLGLTASAFSSSLQFLYISYGVIQGIALTLTFTPGITMIAKYFYKRRGFANGITMAGNALGGIVMPLVAHKLISEYSLRGCFLIMGGILLNACVGAMLWQPVEWHYKKETADTVPILQELPQIRLQDSDVSRGEDIVDEGCDSDHVSSELKPIEVSCKFRSELDLPIPKSKATLHVPEFFHGVEHNVYASGPDLHCHSTAADSQRGSSSSKLAELARVKSGERTESLPNLFPSTLRCDRRASSFLYLSTCPTSGAVLTKEHFVDEDHELPPETRCRSFLKKCAIDRTIFETRRFFVMTASIFFHVLGYPVTQIFLPYRATGLGMSRAQAAALLSVMALADLVGRVGCAWLSDFHFCPRKYWFICGMLLSGVFAFSLPFCRTFPALVAVSSAFGLCCGAYIGLFVVLFADAYAPSQVALAYSVSCVASGLMALAGPPLVGAVLERTGSYLACQSVAAAAQFLGAAAWLADT